MIETAISFALGLVLGGFGVSACWGLFWSVFALVGVLRGTSNWQVVRASLTAGLVPLFDPSRVTMIYRFAEFPTQPARLSYDAQQYKRDWSAIESLVREIASAREFPLTEDQRRCRFCTYRSLCERGGSAGPWQEADDPAALGDQVSLDFEQIGEIEF